MEVRKNRQECGSVSSHLGKKKKAQEARQASNEHRNSVGEEDATAGGGRVPTAAPGTDRSGAAHRVAALAAVTTTREIFRKTFGSVCVVSCELRVASNKTHVNPLGSRPCTLGCSASFPHLCAPHGALVPPVFFFFEACPHNTSGGGPGEGRVGSLVGTSEWLPCAHCRLAQFQHSGFCSASLLVCSAPLYGG